ncbi:MAG TPA: hypothetical protein VLK84_15535 [Longimicrobium sp.]|nr:hypothetical protein [Longimicrobium sp.]
MSRTDGEKAQANLDGGDTRMRDLLHGVVLAAALSLGAPLPGQTDAMGQMPAAGATPDTAQLHRALAAALGEDFQIVHTELSSGLHERGGTFWLVHATPRRSGMFELRYRYDYRDLTLPADPLYTHVEHTSYIRVGERGCLRRRQAKDACLGDTVILPFVADPTGHTFALTFRESSGDWSGYGDAQVPPGTESVPNPLSAHLGFLGAHRHHMPSRAANGLGRTTFTAEFVARAPGRFNLSLSSIPSAAGSVPIVIVPRGQPVTVLLWREQITAFHATQRFSSHWGNEYGTTPLLLQPGDRITLEYWPPATGGALATLFDETDGGAGPRDADPPVITRFPFHVDPAAGFNALVAGHLPAGRVP